MAKQDKVTKLYNQALQGVNSGKRRTDAVIGSAYDQLRAFIGNRKASLTSHDQRILNGMQTILARRQGSIVAAAGQQGADRAYGGAMADYSTQQFNPAATAAVEGQKVDKATVAKGKAIDKTSQTILDIAKEGATQAEAGMHYATALEAAQERQAILQAKIQFAQQKALADHQASLDRKQMIFQQKLASGQLNKNNPSAVAAITQVGQVAAAAQKFISDNPDSSAEEVQAFLNDQGLGTTAATDPGMAAVVSYIIGQFRSTKPSSQAQEAQIVENAIRQFAPSVSSYKKLSQLVRSVINSYHSQLVSAALVPFAPADQGGGGGDYTQFTRSRLYS